MTHPLCRVADPLPPAVWCFFFLARPQPPCYIRVLISHRRAIMFPATGIFRNSMGSIPLWLLPVPPSCPAAVSRAILRRDVLEMADISPGNSPVPLPRTPFFFLNRGPPPRFFDFGVGPSMNFKFINLRIILMSGEVGFRFPLDQEWGPLPPFAEKSILGVTKKFHLPPTMIIMAAPHFFSLVHLDRSFFFFSNGLPFPPPDPIGLFYYKGLDYNNSRCFWTSLVFELMSCPPLSPSVPSRFSRRIFLGFALRTSYPPPPGVGKVDSRTLVAKPPWIRFTVSSPFLNPGSCTLFFRVVLTCGRRPYASVEVFCPFANVSACSPFF